MKTEHLPTHGHHPLLTVDEAAKYLRVSRSRLNSLRTIGGGPRFAKLCGRIVYRAADLDAFIAARLFTNTAEVQARQHAA